MDLGENFAGALFPQREAGGNHPDGRPLPPNALPPMQQAGHLNNHVDDVFPPDIPDENIPLAHGENEDGVIESGVAVANGGNSPDGNKRLSTDCDLVLLLQCHEDLQSLSSSIAKHGTTISIGLDKTTKLHAVFSHFVRFCTASSRNKEPLSEIDLEFVHNQVLVGNETAEGSALMKNDVIKVRRKRVKHMEMELEKEKMQLESDSSYFKQLRSLMGEGAHDVVLECRGTLKESSGRCPTTVRAHSTIVAKRCPWLKEQIRHSREQRVFHPVIRIPNDVFHIEAGTEIETRGNITDETERTKDCDSKTCILNGRLPADISPHDEKRVSRSITGDLGINSRRPDEDDDDDDAVQPFPLPDREPQQKLVRHAAEVVVEEEDLLPIDRLSHSTQGVKPMRPSILLSSSDNDTKKMLWVILEKHAPQAVKLLLEYCYTNRCIPLGSDAFYQSSKGNIVNPFTVWPNDGHPMISMSVALAGIELAEEARMPRFSLMCEVAATHLINKGNVVDALCMCTTLSCQMGNRLSMLRKRAMAHLLERPILTELTKSIDFNQALKKKSRFIVPSMLMGAKDVVEESNKRKRDGPVPVYHDYDEEDRTARNLERQKYAEKRKRRKVDNDHTSRELSGFYHANAPYSVFNKRNDCIDDI